MLHRKPQVAPPEVLARYLSLLQGVFIRVRAIPDLSSEDAEMVRDLADALHNIPELLLQYGQRDAEHYLEGAVLSQIQEFDEKWKGKFPSLGKLLKAADKTISEWD